MCYDIMINNINISLVKWSIWMEGEQSMAKKRRHIISIILIVWIAFIITDFSLAKANKLPIFVIPVIRYKDGGSTEYYGLGYKVIKYVNLTVEEGLKVEKVDFGTWLMDGEITLTVSQSEILTQNN